VSLGLENNEDDVDALISVLDRIARHSPRRRGSEAGCDGQWNPRLPQANIELQMDAFASAASQRVYTQP
jgi:hypothetical protein